MYRRAVALVALVGWIEYAGAGPPITAPREAQAPKAQRPPPPPPEEARPEVTPTATTVTEPPPQEPPRAELATTTPHATDYDPDYDEFRDVVLVGDPGAFRCSGVIVSERFVLTAKHCVPAAAVIVGDDVERGVLLHVAEVVPHASLDLALLRLRETLPLAPPVKVAKGLEPATFKLAREMTITTHAIRMDPREREPIGQIAIVGFGITDQLRNAGFGTKRVRRVDTDGWGCDRRRASALACESGIDLVLRGGRGNDTCFGDSGGGAFERVGRKWRLIGITSRGTRPKRMLCGEGGVYTRTDTFFTWLEGATK